MVVGDAKLYSLQLLALGCLFSVVGVRASRPFDCAVVHSDQVSAIQSSGVWGGMTFSLALSLPLCDSDNLVVSSQAHFDNVSVAMPNGGTTGTLQSATAPYSGMASYAIVVDSSGNVLVSTSVFWRGNVNYEAPLCHQVNAGVRGPCRTHIVAPLLTTLLAVIPAIAAIIFLIWAKKRRLLYDAEIFSEEQQAKKLLEAAMPAVKAAVGVAETKQKDIDGQQPPSPPFAEDSTADIAAFPPAPSSASASDVPPPQQQQQQGGFGSMLTQRMSAAAVGSAMQDIFSSVAHTARKASTAVSEHMNAHLPLRRSKSLDSAVEGRALPASFAGSGSVTAPGSGDLPNSSLGSSPPQRQSTTALVDESGHGGGGDQQRAAGNSSVSSSSGETRKGQPLPADAPTPSVVEAALKHPPPLAAAIGRHWDEGNTAAAAAVETKKAGVQGGKAEMPALGNAAAAGPVVEGTPERSVHEEAVALRKAELRALEKSEKRKAVDAEKKKEELQHGTSTSSSEPPPQGQQQQQQQLPGLAEGAAQPQLTVLPQGAEEKASELAAGASSGVPREPPAVRATAPSSGNTEQPQRQAQEEEAAASVAATTPRRAAMADASSATTGEAVPSAVAPAASPSPARDPPPLEKCRPYLGFSLTEPKDHPGCISVDTVDAGGPADVAGVRVGDRLVAIAGHDVTTTRDARAAVAQHCRPGMECLCVFERTGCSGPVQCTIVVATTEPRYAGKSFFFDPTQHAKLQSPLRVPSRGVE